MANRYELDTNLKDLLQRNRSPRGELQLLGIKDLLIDGLDAETQNHSWRVGADLKRFSQFLYYTGSVKLSLPPTTWFRTMEIGGELHDIGKRDPHIQAITGQSNRLSASERSIIENHTVIGGHYFDEEIQPYLDQTDWETSTQQLSIIRNIIIGHHLGGKNGYPEKKELDEIPIEAQIAKIVDTADALQAKRSYKEAIEKPEDVLKEMRKMQFAEHGFNPQLLDLYHWYVRSGGNGQPFPNKVA